MIAVISLFPPWLYIHVRGLSCNQEPGFAADNLATVFRNFPRDLSRPVIKMQQSLHFSS